MIFDDNNTNPYGNNDSFEKDTVDDTAKKAGEKKIINMTDPFGTELDDKDLQKKQKEAFTEEAKAERIKATETFKTAKTITTGLTDPLGAGMEDKTLQEIQKNTNTFVEKETARRNGIEKGKEGGRS
ncbi:MAG: hypothetical protein ACI8ZF_000684 [Candidatus Midichloriaceae bacterium]|jgi:hypothetical protein